MEPQSVPQQGQGQQRYCPTPMAPPPSSPAPPTVQHQQIHPPSSISPAPHHAGYYSHHPHHSYPQPPQQPQHSYYQQGYYNPANQHQQQQYQQQQQQWGHHHSYYQAQSAANAPHPQQQQSPYQSQGYPPQQPQSAYPSYPQPQQHQQQQQAPPAPPPPSQQQIGMPSQQPQQNPQHALMNLSRFVNQQAPNSASSPIPHPHSPTTPVPMPMGSPIYPGQQSQQGHNILPPSSSPQSILPPPHPSPNHTTNPLHQSYHSSASLQHPLQHENATGTALKQKFQESPIKSNQPSPIQRSGSSSAEPIVQTFAEFPTMLPISNGRSESNSPQSSGSGSSSRRLSSPPTSNANPNNGQMIPVRLQNMQKGARTKASMRKLMQEQHISSGSGSIPEGANLSDDAEAKSADKKKTLPGTPKKGSRTPKKTKKSAAEAAGSADNSSEVTQSDTLESSSTESSALPGFTKKGKKMGRPPKPKEAKESEENPPKKKGGRKPTKTNLSPSIIDAVPPAPAPVEFEETKDTATKRKASRSASPVKSPPPPPPAKSPKKEKATTPSPKKGASKTPAEEVEEDGPEENETNEMEDKQEPSPSKKNSKKRTPVRKGKFGKGKKASPVGKKSPATTDESSTAKKKPVQKQEVESDLEGEEESEMVIGRPQRARAAKTTPAPVKTAAEGVKDRSRHARAKRGSVSYKEMSTSRSKSPKDVQTPSPVKQSPSPPKKSPAKTPTSSTSSPVKSSPRLKDASPSPARVRQLKDEKSPVESRRETRASKEREETIETPKRAPRRSRISSGASNKDAPPPPPATVEKTPTPTKTAKPKKGAAKPKAKPIKKARRDSTPIRMSSPRLAKERSTTPAGQQPKPETPTEGTETLSPESVKSPAKKRATANSTSSEASSPLFVKIPPKKRAAAARPKKLKATPTATTPTATPTTTSKGKKRKASSAQSDLDSTPVVGSADSAEPGEPLEAETPAKKARVTKTPRQKKPKLSKADKSKEVDTMAETSAVGQSQELESNANLLLSPPSVLESPTFTGSSINSLDLSLSSQSQPNQAVGKIAKVAKKRTSKAKSPRQSIDSNPAPAASSSIVLHQLSPASSSYASPVVAILPQIPDSGLNKGFYDSSYTDTPLLSQLEQHFSSQQQQSSSANQAVSVADETFTSNQMNVEGESVISPTKNAKKSAEKKVTKPRKPRAPKPKVSKAAADDSATSMPLLLSPPKPVVEVKKENAAAAVVLSQQPQPSTGTKKKKTKHEQQMEFQQRKANLEVEVAQALLEMKHSSNNSSKSPSPVKSITSTDNSATMTPMLIPTTPTTSQISSEVSKPGKARKRKSSSVETANNTTPKKKVTKQSTLSPDAAGAIAAPKPAKKPRIYKSRAKKTDPSALTQSQPLMTSTPTILAVPQVNGSQNNLNFSYNSSISFQNTPLKKSGGSVKVSKTVIPPGQNDSSAISSSPSAVLSEIDLSMAGASSADSIIFNQTNHVSSQSTSDKPKKAKRVTKKQQKSVESEGGSLPQKVEGVEGEKPAKPKRVRKKKPIVITEMDKKFEISPTGDININGETGKPAPKKRPYKPKAKSANTSGADTTPPSEFKTPAPAGAKKTPVRKRKKVEPPTTTNESAGPTGDLPFQLQPKPMPVPTVVVKSPFFLEKNGSPAIAGTSTSGDKARIGPCLKVLGGKTKFYRSGEEEQLNSEPQYQRGPTQFDPEVPWLCCFCNLGPHVQKLGDLFGPYYVDVGEIEPDPTKPQPQEPAKMETWMHQDCSLWAGNVVLIGSQLHNLKETLDNCRKETCTTCGNKGATIGCLKRGCKQAIHFPCAIRKSWRLDEETFQSFCPAHIA